MIGDPGLFYGSLFSQGDESVQRWLQAGNPGQVSLSQLQAGKFTHLEGVKRLGQGQVGEVAHQIGG